VKIIDGQIVLDEQSLFVDAPTLVPSVDGIITEPAAHITSASYSNRSASEKWSSAETDEFYEAIRRYGTDFTLLEKLFAKRSRKQLKSKFKREEKENPRRVDDALKNTIPIDIDHYHAALNQAAEKKKLLEEQKEQSNSHSQPPTPQSKDDSSWENPTFDTSTPRSQKTVNTDNNSSNNINTGQKANATTEEVEVDIDEETLANIHAQYYGYMNSYEEDDDE